MRYAKYKDYDVTAAGDLNGYQDAGKVSGWARENMARANVAGSIKGDNNQNLNPQGRATRAESATILMRFAQDIEK